MAEQDPTLKNERCTLRFGRNAVSNLSWLAGSAIEILKEGAYASGDLDMCHATAATLPIAQRKVIMGLLDAKGGPRNWQVAGMYLDLLGPAESFARPPYRRVEAPYGSILLMKPDDYTGEWIVEWPNGLLMR